VLEENSCPRILSGEWRENSKVGGEKLWEKYGPKDVKKYYSKFDVAVVVELI
jgi:hypothetical protein